jgi:acetyl esterase/lipase
VLRISCLLLALSLGPAPASPPTLTKLYGIPYDSQHPLQNFDLYHPGFDLPEAAPVAIWLGGGWSIDQAPVDDPYSIDVYSALLSRRIAIAVPDLRPSDSWPFPFPAFDCARVVQHLRHHAAAYHLDPQRVFLMGRSGGGTIAAEIAYGPDFQGLLAKDAVGQQSSRPSAVALISAASSFNAMDDSIVALYFAQPTFAQVPPLLKLIASPGFWVENSTTTPVPSYLVYKGAIGTPPLVHKHDAWHGANLALALTAKGATWDYQYFPDAEVEPTDYAAIAEWLEALP